MGRQKKPVKIFAVFGNSLFTQLLFGKHLLEVFYTNVLDKYDENNKQRTLEWKYITLSLPPLTFSLSILLLRRVRRQEKNYGASQVIGTLFNAVNVNLSQCPLFMQPLWTRRFPAAAD